MGIHILLMNVLAPIVALLSVCNMRQRIIRIVSPDALLVVATGQVLALWASHCPAALSVAAHSAAAHLFFASSFVWDFA
jgi:hypothetical protein